MNRTRIAAWVFGVGAFCLLASGLAFNGPVDLDLSMGQLRGLTYLFVLASLTLTCVALFYFSSSAIPVFQGSTRLPLVIAASSAALEWAILVSLKSNVHLYGPWVIFLWIASLVSGVAVVVLGLFAACGVLVRRRRSSRLNERAG